MVQVRLGNLYKNIKMRAWKWTESGKVSRYSWYLWRGVSLFICLFAGIQMRINDVTYPKFLLHQLFFNNSQF